MSDVKLYEFDVLLRYAIVIAALSEDDARAYLKNGDSGLSKTAEFLDVCNVDLSEVRDRKLSRWESEANDITVEALRALEGDGK